MPAVVPPEQSTPSWILTFKLLERLAKGFTWVGSFLLLVGLACAWRIFLRPEHLTLFCMNLLLLVISRIRYWTSGLDLRYFMPMVIVGCSLDGLGPGARHRRRASVAPAAWRTLAAGVADAGRQPDRRRRGMQLSRRTDVGSRLHAEARGPGTWIYNHAGPEPAIAGNLDHLTLDTFYSNGHVVGIFWPRDCLMVPMPRGSYRAKGRCRRALERREHRQQVPRDHRRANHRRTADIAGSMPRNSRRAGQELMVFVKE